MNKREYKYHRRKKVKKIMDKIFRSAFYVIHKNQPISTEFKKGTYFEGYGSNLQIGYQFEVKKIDSVIDIPTLLENLLESRRKISVFN